MARTMSDRPIGSPAKSTISDFIKAHEFGNIELDSETQAALRQLLNKAKSKPQPRRTSRKRSQQNFKEEAIEDDHEEAVEGADSDFAPPAPLIKTENSSSPLTQPPFTITSTRAPKRPRTKPSYKPPSFYDHLPKLPDKLGPDLICVFIGLNAGLTTAKTGHSYAHPNNLFWRLLHRSGCTPVRCYPEDDVLLPARYGLGNTNLVDRPSRNQAELSAAELEEGVEGLEAKIALHRPLAVCIVGKGIWEAIFKVRHGRKLGKKDWFQYGWQEGETMGMADEWKGARIFVATSTSGLAASTSPDEKERIWAVLGGWVREQRMERYGHEN